MTVSAQQSFHSDEVEKTRIARWRFDQFRSLGFDVEDAFVLSASGVDLQVARTLMEAGCSVPLALRILL
jgi:hypothetical protein